MRHLVSIVSLLAVLAGGAASAAESPIRVAVAPFVYVAEPLAGSDFASRDAVITGLQSWVAGHGSEFTLASVATTRREVLGGRAYPEIVEIARLHARDGSEKYRELDPQGAAQSLRTAIEQFYRADHQFVDPREVSETLLFLALALLDSERGNPTEPLNVMEEMVLIDPGRKVTVGAFPDAVVGFYESAHMELEGAVREGGPSEGWPKRVASLTTADYVLVGNVLDRPGDTADVVVWLYDVDADQFRTSAKLTVRSPTPDRLQAAADRLASRLLTCLVDADAPVEQTAPLPSSSGESPVALQINFAYGSYYQFPNVGGQAVEPFDNLGAAVGGAFYLTREFAVLAMFQFLASTTEFSGLVQPGFTTLRSFAGGEIGVGFGRFRFALGTLLEGTAVSRITTCPGPDVEARRFCEDAEELPARFIFGVNARPRLSYGLLDSLQLFVGGSTSFYFLPLASDALNFLTTAEAGLQYRF